MTKPNVFGWPSLPEMPKDLRLLKGQLARHAAIWNTLRPAGEPPMPKGIRDPAYPARDVPLSDKLAGRIEGLASAAEAMRDQAKGAVGNMTATDRAKGVSHARRAERAAAETAEILDRGGV